VIKLNKIFRLNTGNWYSECLHYAILTSAHDGQQQVQRLVLEAVHLQKEVGYTCDMVHEWK